MEFQIGQICDAVEGEHQPARLRAIKYQYALKPQEATEPVFRWEYDRATGGDGLWCRHHIQGPHRIDFGAGRSANLNAMHAPTGWVGIEEVIRFCIVDLGVLPLDDRVDATGIPVWDMTLRESIQRSRRAFAILDD